MLKEIPLHTKQILSNTKHLWGMLCVALILRIPFFFLRTFHNKSLILITQDESVFLYQGREILAGFLPYERVWDNRAPLGWYLSALINMVSGDDIWVARLIATLLIVTTAYIIYKIGKKYAPYQGVMAGYLYVLLASTIEKSQSLIYDHIFACVLAYLLFKILNYNHTKKALLTITLLFAACCQLLSNGLLLGPALAYILASQNAGNTPQRLWQNIFKYGVILLIGLIASYFLLWLVYWYHDLDTVLLFSLFKASAVIANKPLGIKFIASIVPSITGFYAKYFTYSLTPQTVHYSLAPILLLIVTIECIHKLTKKQPLEKYTLYYCALLILGIIIIGIRGTFSAYYILQILPIICLACGTLATSKYYYKIPAIIFILLLGTTAISATIGHAYKPSISFAENIQRWQKPNYKEEINQLAIKINRSEKTSEYIFTCPKIHAIYILTNRRTPTYSIIPFLKKSRAKKMMAQYDKNQWKMFLNKNTQFVINSKRNICGKSKPLSKILRTHYKPVFRTAHYVLLEKR